MPIINSPQEYQQAQTELTKMKEQAEWLFNGLHSAPPDFRDQYTALQRAVADYQRRQLDIRNNRN